MGRTTIYFFLVVVFGWSNHQASGWLLCCCITHTHFLSLSCHEWCNKHTRYFYYLSILYISSHSCWMSFEFWSVFADFSKQNNNNKKKNIKFFEGIGELGRWKIQPQQVQNLHVQKILLLFNFQFSYFVILNFQLNYSLILMLFFFIFFFDYFPIIFLLIRFWLIASFPNPDHTHIHF